MRTLALILFSALSLASNSALAASYQLNNGTIVDPILLWEAGDGPGRGAETSSPHPYSGIDLEPYANLQGASLAGADLYGAALEFADLRDADLSGAVLLDANLNGADLRGANLSGTVFAVALMTGADFSGADLSNAIGLGELSGPGPKYYDSNTDFTGAFDAIQFNYDGDLGTFSGYGGSNVFDPVAAGWTLVPEPSTTLLFGLGLAGLASRRR